MTRLPHTGLATAMARTLVRELGRPLARRDPFGHADAIVVLGAPLLPDGRIGSALEERIVTAVELWKRGAAPILCVTGGGPPRRNEADAMAQRAIELGVTRDALRIERRATSTSENARYTGDLLLAEGCRTVWIVSQPFHLRRARMLFARRGFIPLTWHAADSLQYEQPRLALRWVAREYAALAHWAGIATWKGLRRIWPAGQARRS